MNTLIRGCLGALLLLVGGCTSPHLEIFPELSDPTLSSIKIAPEKLRQDVDALIEGVVARHPDIHHYADLPAIYAQAEALKLSLNEPMTRVAFFQEVGALSHLFNDGHSFLIWPYQEYNSLKEKGSLTFPFALDIFPDGVFLKHDYRFNEQYLAKGTRLLEINNISIEQVFSKAKRYVGGETEILRKHTVAARFPQMLWSVFGFVDEYTLNVEIDGEMQQLIVASDSRWQLEDTNPEESNSDFFFELKTDGVGYLNIASFDVSPDWFEDFADDAFTQINSANLKTLIIDIRENGGGNTDTATYLARYIADRPFRMVSSMRERLNKDNRGFFNYRGEVDDIVVTEWDDWESPMDETERFTGDTYVLMSPVTYSSAIVFATAVQDHQFATIVGRETGGYANQTAQGNLFNLPHSELRFYVATRLLVRPNGELQVNGVVPDIVVTASQEQIQRGVDADIEAVLALVNSEQ